MNLDNLLTHLQSLQIDFISRFPRNQWTSEFKENLKNDFIFYSTHIEGNKISYGDTIQFLKEGLISSNSSLKDITDLANHKQILEKVFSLHPFRKITENDIKEIHRELMKDIVQWGNVSDAYNIAGDYRQDQRFGARENGFKEYLDFHKIRQAMKQLVGEYNVMLSEQTSSTIQKHPLYTAAFFHNKFLNDIHPFAEGNGRACRILINLHLINADYPVLLIKDKKEYIDTIISCEAKDSPEPMVILFAKCLINIMEEKLK